MEQATGAANPFWERVAWERARQGLSWAEIGRRAELSISTIHDSRKRSPQPRTVAVVADVLGIDRIEAAVLAGLIPSTPKAAAFVTTGRAA